MRTALAWYRREDYDRWLAMVDDRDVWEDTYDEWLACVEDLLRQKRPPGTTIVKTILDPDAFAAWCRARGRKLDGSARADYAVESMVKGKTSG
ncbi:MAG TPA: hypothetical protein DEH78_09930 [Solibacterales bacterium]|nr:hypothetical protein [Bryobacterales bacterium]